MFVSIILLSLIIFIMTKHYKQYVIGFALGLPNPILVAIIYSKKYPKSPIK